MRPRLIVSIAIAASLLVGGLWSFPSFWYTKAGLKNPLWLTENTNVVSWTYSPVPIAKSQEAALNADVTSYGAFTNRSHIVQVFCAKRFSDDPNEIGLFVHTPDRCWTEAGWKLEPASPDSIMLDLHGASIIFERRIFSWKAGEQFLVYFGGLAAGAPLPYRLDHNLSVGQKQQFQNEARGVGARARAVDQKFWGRVWQTFLSRRQFVGPKQFVRVATPMGYSFDPAADDRLKTVLQQWLQPGDLTSETLAWQSSREKKK